MAGGPAVAGQTGEEGRLLDGRQWDYQPLAAIKFHIRIRRAPCVSFFSRHTDLPFLLDSQPSSIPTPIAVMPVTLVL